MTFSVRGRLGGDNVTVEWDDGRVSGTPAAVDAVQRVLEANDTLRISPQSADRPATPSDAAAVLAATQAALDEITAVEGDYPIPEADSSAS